MDTHHSNEESMSEQSPSGFSPSQARASGKNSYSKKAKDNKPKRNKSAFILFSIEERAKLKSALHDQVNSNEMMVKLAEKWKQLSKEEREIFETEAKNDKMRYLREVEDFSKTHPDETIHNKTKKNHVKKPCSAYALFLKETKKVIKAEAPHLKMADVLKVVSEKWKSLNEDERVIFQDRAKVEKDMVKALLDQKVLKESARTNLPQPVKKLCVEAEKRPAAPAVEIEPTEVINIKEETIKMEEDQVKLEHSHNSTTPSESYVKEEAVGGFDEMAKRMFQNLSMQFNQTLYSQRSTEASENQSQMLLNLFNVNFRKSSELLMSEILTSNSMRNPLSSVYNYPFLSHHALPTMRNCQPMAPSRSKVINNVIISALDGAKKEEI